jgi:beta-barrel assembly-enhancing protease
MWMLRFMVFLACLLLPLGGVAEGLPELGEASQGLLTPQIERKIGVEFMRDIREHETSFFDDAEVTEYINNLGSRLVAASPEARQDIEFFVLRDPTLNAFAMPGGFIAVHTGTITSAQSESELASVMAHEIGHVVQRHLARQIGAQSNTTLPMLAAMVVGILAARSNAQVTQATIMGAQAAAIQSQLNYSRDFEREADRIGLQTLQGAGFDVRAAPEFFERLQRYTRVYENNAPNYLRTHPVTAERIADLQGRIQDMSYRQAADSLEFNLVRAKLKAELEQPKDAVAAFSKALKDHVFASAVVPHYGMARALMRIGDFAGAQQQVDVIRKLQAGLGDPGEQRIPSNSVYLRSPMLENLAGQVRLGAGDAFGAIAIYADALRIYPDSKPLIYANGEALLAAKKYKEAEKFVNAELQIYPRNEKLFDLQARIFEIQGKQLAHHRALGELMALRGNLPGAIDQYQLAQKSADGDFFEESGVDARLRELQRLRVDEMKDEKLGMK